ncbi:MAG: exopolysaccharide biosynthesis protein [Parachlamydiaceae bacterium]|nr:exopolysaccharide biosynthesis protein [Parachlamydiaceae bacterium]
MKRKKREFKTLEESILLLKKEVSSMPITIGEILHILSGRGRALFLILLSLPFCQPLQIPGFSTPFGLTIAFLGLRMAFDGHVWLPSWILSKSIAARTLEKILDKILFLLKKVKRLIHPRLSWMCRSSVMQVVNGIAIFFLGLFLALPLPIPFSNIVAAWSIFLIALGISEGDGIVVLMGYLVALLTVIVFIAMAMTMKHIF